MKKILSFLDDNILRFSIALALFFIPLYPKIPSIGISHVWVYVRLEDFVILLVTVIWVIQLLRKKVALPKAEGYAIAVYWFMGLASLIYCFLFLASHLVNFFPQIAVLEYLRRIEYMILFFAAFSSVKKRNDIVFYLTTVGITLALITLYGFGQKFYSYLWIIFPFLKDAHFCFPAFLTGNEEFAKGTPFCLDTLSRVSSTFGGNYDLSAFLVLFIPLFIALFIGVKRLYFKVFIGLLVILALELLNFTSSRTSFAAYLFGAITMLIIWKKKLWIIPVVIVSVSVLFLLSTATLQRFAKTIQPVQVVQVQPGANPELQQIISQTQTQQANKHPQSPAPGTVTVGNGGGGGGLPGGSSQVLTEPELQSLEEQNINISTDSGAFLLSKAYALDISFTTRFQAEWPRDWQAFLSSPLFGTGYSSLTLASDNDYLRALGETGFMGTLAFLMIFVMFGIFMKNILSSVKDPVTKALLFGLAGGVIGLLANAALIDVFEASKVAEPLWILLGIAVGGAKLYQKEPIPYKKELLHFFTSTTMIFVYFVILIFLAFGNSISNFFVAGDFIWLHWAAKALPSDLPKYFISSGDFFYRPLDKIIMYFLYMTFSFQPQGYHLFIFFLHFLTASGVYLFAKKLSGKRVIGALTALLFVLHPAHSENIFWISTISDDLSSFAIIYMMLTFICFREKKSLLAYFVSILLGAVAFASYEIAVIVPFILLALDIFILKPKRNPLTVLSYMPFVILFVLYFILRIVSHSFFGGGDYSYHLSRILPNILGNFFGYTGLALGGLPFLAFYNMLRNGLRSEWIYFTIVAILVIGYLGWMIVGYKEKIKKLLRHSQTQVIIFCLVFAFIAVSPFLPLGNIAPHYLYLASVGYLLALVMLLELLFMRLIKNPRYAVLSLVAISVFLAGVYFFSNFSEQEQWEKSGMITQNTLLFFRKNYPAFTVKTNLYFVDTPVMQHNVWIFPVGLSDGLWFIYRNNLPQVHQVGSLKEAQTAVTTNGNQDTYIFQFDPQGNISAIK